MAVVKRIPESYKSASVDSYAREIAVCRCGGSLHFSTDMNGYVIESCDRCKVSRQMTRAPRREELDPMPTGVKPAELTPCLDCGTKLQWSGYGNMPHRCKECRRERRRGQHREWRKRRAA